MRHIIPVVLFVVLFGHALPARAVPSAVLYGADCNYPVQTFPDGSPREIIPHQNLLFVVLSPTAGSPTTRFVHCTIPTQFEQGFVPNRVSIVLISGGPLEARLCFSTSSGGSTCGRPVPTTGIFGFTAVPLPDTIPPDVRGAFLALRFRSGRTGASISILRNYTVLWRD